jgi:hypothetical protein
MEIADGSQTGLDPAGSFSVWFWLELLATSGHSGRYLVFKDHSTAFQYLVWFTADDGSTIDIEVYETSGGNQHRRTFTGLSLSVDTPTHLAITFDGGAVSADAQYELWKNGASQGNGSLVSGALVSGTFASDGPFKVGGGTGDTENADQVRLFDLRFYNIVKAPSTTTYKQLLTSPATESNLQLNLLRGTDRERWAKNAGIVQDASTNGNDLAITYQAVADVPLEIDSWPGPGNGGVTLPGEVDVAGNGVVGGPSREGVVYSSPNFVAAGGNGVPPLQTDTYSSKNFLAVDGAYRSLGAEPGGGGLTYRMRGFDQNVSVNDIVFWDSDHVDATAADYTGSAGPVINIVVQKKIGA